MVRWFVGLAEAERWDGALPAAFAARLGSGDAARRAWLRQLAARALGKAAAEVGIEHRLGHAPHLTLAGSTSLHLSASGRGEWAAAALAAGPVGIDVERVVPGAEIPWNVLPSAEAALLRQTASGLVRDQAFARLWTVKEAYLKALGTGLSRGPESVAVRPVDAERAEVEDQAAGVRAVARTIWPVPDAVVASVVLLTVEEAGAGSSVR